MTNKRITANEAGKIMNKDKAIEIAKKHHRIYDDYYDSMQECIDSAMEMARWKDEQQKELVAGIIRNLERGDPII